MMSYAKAFACALALISNISTASSLQMNDIISLPPTAVASKVIDTVSDATSKATGIISSVVPSATSTSTAVSSSFPSDIFPSFVESTTLSCKYGSSIISGTSELVELSVSQTSLAPTFFASSPLSGTYILIMIDPDVVTPQILHFMQPGMVVSSNSTSKNSSSITITALEPAAVKYLGPAPLAGSGLHRYIMFLFIQPIDFTLSEDFDAADRSGFDIASFASEHGLGEPVAATFFGAQNVSGNLTNGSSGNLTNGSIAGNLTSGHFSGNGTYGNSTRIGSSLNGTKIIDSFHGNSTNGTLHGTPLYGNGTSSSNSTLSGGNHNGTSSFGNNTMSSASASLPLSSSDSSDDESGSDSDSDSDEESDSTSTGPIPISPTAVADSSTINPDSLSSGGSATLFANFALAGFVGVVTVVVAYL